MWRNFVQLWSDCPLFRYAAVSAVVGTLTLAF